MEEEDGGDPQFLPPQVVVTGIQIGRRDPDNVPVMVITSTEREPFALLIDEGELLPAMVSALSSLLPRAARRRSPGRSGSPVLRTYASGSFRWAVGGAERPELSIALRDGTGLHLTLSQEEARAIGNALLARAAAPGGTTQ